MSDNQGWYLDSRLSDSPCKASNEDEPRSFRLSNSKESREKSELRAGNWKEKTNWKLSSSKLHIEREKTKIVCHSKNQRQGCVMHPNQVKLIR